MTDKFITVAEINVPNDPSGPAKIIEYKGGTHKREFMPGVIKRVVEIYYSEETHGKIDAIYVNGVRFIPEDEK